MTPVSRRLPRGLTLLEAALSAALLGGVVAATLAARSRAAETAATARDTWVSTALAASRAAEVRAAMLDAGEGVSERPAGWTWAVGPASVAGAGARRREVRAAPSGRDAAAGASLFVWTVEPAPEGEGAP
jgi:hypothetical protein